MSVIEIGPALIQTVAKALRLDPQGMHSRMRDGTMTSLFEHGQGADAGRVRLTFFSATRRVRITASEVGEILNCSAVDYGQSPPKRRDDPD